MVKCKIGWSIDAKLDLIEILDFYTKQNKSYTYSIKLNTKINNSIKLLSKNPFLGIPTDYDSVRTLITGNYQIIYEVYDRFILIIMIWDSRRNSEDKIIVHRIKHK